MINRRWIRLLAWVRRERRWFVAGGLDVVETTRRSVLSVEGRIGMALFAGLCLVSPLQAPAPRPFPFDPGPAFARLAADAAAGEWMFRLEVLGFTLALGALLGVFLRNAWDLAEEFAPIPPRRAWDRRLRWGVTGAVLVFLHGGFLLSAMRAAPDLYAPAFKDRAWPLRWVQTVMAEGFFSWPCRLMTLGAYAIIGAGTAQMARRFRRWFGSFPLRTRLACGVMGAGSVFLLMGLWGVFRFHLPRNEGPNAVVLIVEGLRSEDLKAGERTPFLAALSRRGRVFASCVPTIPRSEPALMTLLTGRSPLSHGVRDAFPAGGDVRLDADSLPERLRRAGFQTAVLAGDGGDFLGRVSSSFDRVRAPDLSVPGILRRDTLRRAVHLLPYLRGRWARTFVPALRAVPELNEPRLLGREAEGWLRQLRFERRFFLAVHFTLGGGLAAVDRGADGILRALEDLDLDDRTWVFVWSPFASEDGRDPASPSRFSAPFVVAGPVGRPAPRWVRAPVRDVDAAPTILSALGLLPSESMEGLSLLEADPDTPAFASRGVYAESDLWMDPDDNPLPADVRPSFGAASSWLEEDPEAPGRLRVRPSAADALSAIRHRLFQTGNERIVYRPGRFRVVFQYYDLLADPRAARDLAGTRAGQDRVRDLKEPFFQELRRETGWRPQNDYWIPEALMRDKQ